MVPTTRATNPTLLRHHSPMTERSAPALIPRHVIFGNPEADSPQISPDGAHLAFLRPVDGVLNVWVRRIDRDDARPVTRDTDRGVQIYFWHHGEKRLLFVQDSAGDENWQLFEADIETGDVRLLTPFDGVQTQIVSYTKHHPFDMIVGLNVENQALHDPYHLDLRSGGLTRIAENPGNVVGWLADTHLQVRAAQAAQPDGGFVLLLRDDNDTPWHPVVEWSSEDALNSGPLHFSRDGTGLFLLDSRDADTSRLVRLELATGDRTVLAEDPRYDVGAVLTDSDTREPLAVAFARDRVEWRPLDPTVQDDLERVLGIGDGDVGIYDGTADQRTWLVASTVDTGPMSYYAFHRDDGTATLLFRNRPALLDYQLASMKPFAFSTQDGLTVHGYLTVPIGVTGPCPMVVNVHGGPWHRDTWGYDAEAQWLANRGYACLQVNFRGSTGYGKQFLNAADREWGGRMHSDLVDAVQWAVSEGIADPDRIGIYGGSYGGYAALVGATFTPDLFRCAIDLVGPSNLITFIESVPPYWSAYLEMLYRRVGHPERDEDFLRERSPLFRVDAIRIPLLVAQGANDPRVKATESEQIVAALREKGIDHEYLVFEDEGHGFVKPENRLRFYEAAERFLARHLGGRCEERRES